jgi:hypothetical protein
LVLAKRLVKASWITSSIQGPFGTTCRRALRYVFQRHY